MVAMGKSPVVFRAAPIAASMAIDRPRGDRTRSRKARSAAEDGGRGLVCSARNAAAGGRGKKSPSGVAEAGRGEARTHRPDQAMRGEMDAACETACETPPLSFGAQPGGR